MEENTDLGNLLYDSLAVIVQTKDGKCFQVALDKEMSDALFNELKMFFKGGVVKILPTEIKSISLEYKDINETDLETF